MSLFLRATAPDIEIFGDGSSTIAKVDLADYPVSVPFTGKFPDRVSVIDTATSQPIPSTVKNSVVTVTFGSTIAIGASVTIRVTLEYDV